MTRFSKTFCFLTLFACAACGDDGPDATLQQTTAVAGSGAMPPVVPPLQTGTATLIVENRYTNLTITGVFLSPSYVNKWGSNQLQGKLLPPGENLTLRQIPCNDYYDLKISGPGGAEIGTVTEIYFACGVEKVVTLSR